MVFLFIGPSGVGKSSLLCYANAKNKDKKWAVIDLDEAVSKDSGFADVGTLFVKVGANNFFERCKSIIEEEMERQVGQSEVKLIAIGVGMLEADQALSWFTDNRERTVLITADPQTVYSRDSERQQAQRTGNSNRIFEDYKKTEFSSARCELYNLACHKFYNNESLETEQERFLNFLEDFI